MKKILLILILSFSFSYPDDRQSFNMCGAGCVDPNTCYSIDASNFECMTRTKANCINTCVNKCIFTGDYFAGKIAQCTKNCYNSCSV